jgi:tetratricopeptide (TPR) repeat protein
VVLEAIRQDSSLCERLWFYLGDAADASRDASIWVVDVPRRKAEQTRNGIALEEFARWLAQPRIAVGDYVVVTGRWATSSSHDKATHGLLVYQSLEHAKPPTAAPTAVRTAAPTARPVARVESPARMPEAAVATRPPQRRWIPVEVFNASVDHLNACTREVAAGHHDAAIAQCKAAIARWDGNHLAWYTLASAHIAKAEWAQARSAVERAVRLRPDRAMYQQYYGMALYEAEHSLDAARDALVRATRLDPRLWRAHYYLGCVHRDLDDARRSAEAFTRAIAAHPREGASYVALSELYRSWDYFDQALEVAQLGITLLPSDADLWYEVGMAYAAQHLDDPAIVVFDKAIAERPGDARSRFHRGQIYLRQDNRPAARRDLEAVVASDDPQAAEVKAIAAELLSRMKW